jgi:hypothetical protein
MQKKIFLEKMRRRKPWGRCETRVQGAGCKVQGARCRVQGAGCRVQGASSKGVNRETVNRKPFKDRECEIVKSQMA